MAAAAATGTPAEAPRNGTECSPYHTQHDTPEPHSTSEVQLKNWMALKWGGSGSGN